jgi:lysophospholipase L1-like esterase
MKAFLLSLLLILTAMRATAGTCDALSVAITTTPVLYQWPSGLDKATRLLQSPPDTADIVLVGDSLLAFWPKDLAERQFGPGRVWNFAVGGSRTQHLLWQLDRLDAPHLAPREVVVLIGTNNLTDETLPACAIVAGIEAVAERVRSRWPGAVIHIMGIPPRGSDFHFRDADRKRINAAVRLWSRERAAMRYFEVDDLRFTCGRYAAPPAPQEVAATGSRCVNYADDFGHFRRPGYGEIYSALRGADR